MAGFEGMNEEFARRLQMLIAASGGRIWLSQPLGGFRSYEEQAALYQAAVAKYGPDLAGKYVAPPGASNHNRGLAADLEGDMQLLHQLAPMYGLVFPMSYEPWHVELAGAREDSPPEAYPSPGPSGQNPTTEKIWPEEAFALVARVITQPFTMDSVNLLNQAEEMGMTVPTGGTEGTAVGPTSSEGGAGGIDAFMNALKMQESGGDYTATNPSGASGAYQFMPATWKAVGGTTATAAQASPADQDRIARAYALRLYQQYGNWADVASVWYSGQPLSRAPQGAQGAYPSVPQYVQQLLSRAGLA